MPTKKKVTVTATVRLDTYNIIAQVVEDALSPIRLERFFKHYSASPTTEQFQVISDNAADAVMSALCEVMKFD